MPDGAAFFYGGGEKCGLTVIQATRREEELEKKNRGLKNKLQQSLLQQERMQREWERREALAHAESPSSQRFLPQPHPTK
ncbi:MAG TPA: hypothetical protein VHC22_24945 [Pirellulales bacterium]|nr:hypothetical protein [Pirellulales bacterium]